MQNALIELPVVEAPAESLERLIEMALATCPSKTTRRLYAVQLRKFVASGQPLNREGVALYLASERERGMGGSSITSIIAAIRKLVTEAAIRGAMSQDEANQIKSISVGRDPKTKAGLWLTIAQVRRLRSLPDRSEFWGKRDACLLSILVGCGLRRFEMAELTWDHYQERDGRPCLVDVIGKGRKARTLPVPTWAIKDVEAWREACHAPQPPNTGPDAYQEDRRARDFQLVAGGLKEDTIHKKVQMYGKRMKLNLAPHDLRRTLAQMMRRAGAPLEQIQATLGHDSLNTTMIYLGSCLELGKGKASVDTLNLHEEDADES
jgi:site-specific recombinase XerD